jgi:hypothetical protein
MPPFVIGDTETEEYLEVREMPLNALEMNVPPEFYLLR